MFTIEEFHNMYPPINIIRVAKLRGMRREGM
jgi:hypothetical protein